MSGASTERKLYVIRHRDSSSFLLTPSSRFLFQLNGCVIVKTKQAVLVATYVAPIQQTECTPIVEGLGDYLINLGY